MVYVSAVYWAITTCATVGYGDIVPLNNYEIFACLWVIILGVAIFSFTLSDLASSFSELLKTSRLNEERERQLKELEKTFKASKDLIE